MMEQEFTTNGLKDFLNNFNKVKYQFLPYALWKELTPEDCQRIDQCNMAMRKDPRAAAIDDWNPSPLSKNLRNIYGLDHDAIWDHIHIYQGTRQRVVQDYIAITGMDHLFSQHYFHLEWYLHLNPDFVKGSPPFYRDHFLHQVKDAWMGSYMLWDLELDRQVTLWLLESQNEKLPRIINLALDTEVDRRLMEMKTSTDHPLEEILCIVMKRMEREGTFKENYRKFFGDPEQYTSWSKVKENVDLKTQLLLWALLKHELIYMTWFISALMHDIGYPLNYYRSVTKEIEAFLPNLHALFSESHNDFHKISALLADSMLFRTIPQEELKREFDEGIHGTVSAIAMLDFFYSRSAVHTLTPLQQCAIDWAAVCIQQHTQTFERTSFKSKGKVVDRFESNPLAFLLRMADDLQEWGRFYYHIGSDGKLFFCNRCNLPMVDVEQDIPLRTQDKRFFPILHEAVSSGFEPVPFAMPHRRFRCGCEDLNPVLEQETYFHSLAFPFDRMSLFRDGSVEQYRAFDYRALYTIDMCTGVKIQAYANEEGQPDVTGVRFPHLKISMQYDRWKQLAILLDNVDFARLRIKDVNGLKRMLVDQFHFPEVEIDAFLSDNPIWIKVQILKDILDLDGWSQQVDGWIEDNRLPEQEMDDFQSWINKALEPFVWDTYGRSGHCATCTNKGCIEYYEALKKEAGTLIEPWMAKALCVRRHMGLDLQVFLDEWIQNAEMVHKNVVNTTFRKPDEIWIYKHWKLLEDKKNRFVDALIKLKNGKALTSLVIKEDCRQAKMIKHMKHRMNTLYAPLLCCSVVLDRYRLKRVPEGNKSVVAPLEMWLEQKRKPARRLASARREKALEFWSWDFFERSKRRLDRNAGYYREYEFAANSNTKFTNSELIRKREELLTNVRMYIKQDDYRPSDAFTENSDFFDFYADLRMFMAMSQLGAKKMWGDH